MSPASGDIAAKGKQRNLRKRKADTSAEASSPDDDQDSLRTVLQEAKLLQKAKARPAGLSADVLLSAVAEDGVQALAGKHGNSELLEAYVKEEVREVEALDPEMEKYVETQLAKRLGRTDAAETAAPLDAQQREEQELYGIPENLKAPKHKVQDVSSWMTGIQEVPLPMAYKLRNIEETEAAKKRLLHSAAAGTSRAALEEEEEGGVEEGPRGPQRGIYPRDFGRQSANAKPARGRGKDPRSGRVSFKDRRRKE